MEPQYIEKGVSIGNECTFENDGFVGIVGGMAIGDDVVFANVRTKKFLENLVLGGILGKIIKIRE